MLVAPSDHPLAQRDRVTLTELGDYPLLLSAPGTALRDELELQAARAGVRLQPQAEIDGVRLPRRSRSRASAPRCSPRRRSPTAVNGAWKRLPVKGLARRSVGLAYRRRGMLSAPGPRSGGHRARRRAGPGDRSARFAPRPPRTVVSSLPMRVAIRAGTRGCVTARVDDIGGRPAVVLEIDPSDRKGALSSDDGESIAIAAHIALGRTDPPRRLHRARAAPTSSRAWPRSTAGGWRPGRWPTARASCPIVLASTGPAVSGPALLLGLADLVVMTERRLRLRQRPDDGRRVHRRAHRHRRARRRQRARPPHRRGVARRRRHRGRASTTVAELLVVPPRAHRRDAARAGRPTIPLDRLTPEAGELHPDVVDRQLRRPRRHRAPSSTTASCSSCASRWAPNLVTAFATIGGRPVGIVANQPHRPRRHARHPGVAEGRPLRRRSATRSTCRSSRSSTRPASIPGKDLEWRGMIRHGAQLVVRLRPGDGAADLRRSCARATAAPTSSWTRKKMGNDLCLAWPRAELAVMGAERRGRDPASPGDARGARRARGATTRSACSTRTSPPSAATSTR